MSLKPTLFTQRNPPEDDATGDYYVLGGGPIGEAVAQRLRDAGNRTSIVDESYESTDIPGYQGDPADLQILKNAELTDESTIIVATRKDRQNLLIAQLVSAHFNVGRIIVVANSPDKHDLLAEAGHDPVCATTAISEALVSDL